MSTGAIIAIVAVALVLIALAVLVLPRMRGEAKRKKAERELERRRERAAIQERQAAQAHEERAEDAERHARMAQQVAERERAEAGLRAERADLHETGRADDQLIGDEERHRFADVTDRGDEQRARPSGELSEPIESPADQRSGRFSRETAEARDEERVRRT